MRQIMRSSLDYAGFAQLCGRSPIMREIMRAHNRIIPRSLLSGNSLRQTAHTHRASVHQAAKLVAALLRVAGVTAGLAESNGNLPPGLWLTSPASWLPRTGISSGTIRSVIEYGLPLPFLLHRLHVRSQTYWGRFYLAWLLKACLRAVRSASVSFCLNNSCHIDYSQSYGTDLRQIFRVW